MASKLVKLIVFVPIEDAERVRLAMGDAGAGAIGAFSKYSHCSFSSRGVGRFKPLPGANPHIGEIGEITAVEEERIETACPREKLAAVITAMKSAHPYEEVAYEIYALEDSPV